MKKLILIFLFFFLNWVLLFAQSTWHNTFINNPNNITKILPYNDDTYFCFTTYNNTYLKTTNSGINWTIIKFIDSLINIRDGQFLNSLTGWIGGYNSRYPYTPYLFKTTNGGSNWILQNFDNSNSTIASLFFINENTGFVCGLESGNSIRGKISKTTDGGTNWTSSFFDSTQQLRKIRFIDNNMGFTIGNKLLAKTTNCGNTWTNIAPNTAIANMLFLDFSITSPSDYWVTCIPFAPVTNGYIYYSSNSGQNWNLKYSYSTVSGSDYKYYWNILFINASTGFLSGYAYYFPDKSILMTTNIGNSWFYSYSNLPFDAYSMCYYNNKIFVGGGLSPSWPDPKQNHVVKSTNAGINWSLFEYNWDYTFGDVYFINNNDGLAIPTFGSPYANHNSIFKTTNSGLNWCLVYRNDSIKLGNFALSDNSNVIINCNNSKLLRTTNFGNNWTEIQINVNLGVIKFVNSTSAWSYAGNFLYKTSNSGFNWIQVQLPNISGYTINDISFINELTGWVLAVKQEWHYPNYSYYYTSILKTTNSGMNWTVIYTYGQQGYDYYTKLKFFDQNNGLMISLEGNKFIKTTNSGFNWFDDQSNFNITAYNFYMLNQNTGWVFGSDDGLSKTTNGGHNWVLQFSKPSLYISSFFAFDSTDVWFGSNYSGIYHSTNGGNVFNKKISSEIPSAFSLFQNYPNPFNPVTKIKFDIKKEIRSQSARAEEVKLIIYDILGKEISTLVNEILQPGSYEVTFDGSNLPSGIYFYQLRAGEFTDTKKLVLLK